MFFEGYISFNFPTLSEKDEFIKDVKREGFEIAVDEHYPASTSPDDPESWFVEVKIPSVALWNEEDDPDDLFENDFDLIEELAETFNGDLFELGSDQVEEPLPEAANSL